MKHPSEVELNEYAEDRLETSRRWDVARHLQDCPECQESLAGLTWATTALAGLQAEADTDHPALEDLAALKEGRLAAARRADLVTHLGACPECAHIYGALPHEKRQLPLMRHWQPLAAAAAVVLVIAVVLFANRPGQVPGTVMPPAMERVAKTQPPAQVSATPLAGGAAPGGPVTPGKVVTVPLVRPEAGSTHAVKGRSHLKASAPPPAPALPPSPGHIAFAPHPADTADAVKMGLAADGMAGAPAATAPTGPSGPAGPAAAGRVRMMEAGAGPSHRGGGRPATGPGGPPPSVTTPSPAPTGIGGGGEGGRGGEGGPFAELRNAVQGQAILCRQQKSDQMLDEAAAQSFQGKGMVAPGAPGMPGGPGLPGGPAVAAAMPAREGGAFAPQAAPKPSPAPLVRSNMFDRRWLLLLRPAAESKAAIKAERR